MQKYKRIIGRFKVRIYKIIKVFVSYFSTVTNFYWKQKEFSYFYSNNNDFVEKLLSCTLCFSLILTKSLFFILIFHDKVYDLNLIKTKPSFVRIVIHIFLIFFTHNKIIFLFEIICFTGTFKNHNIMFWKKKHVGIVIKIYKIITSN